MTRNSSFIIHHSSFMAKRGGKSLCLAVLSAVIFTLLTSSQTSYAKELSSTELIGQARELDSKSITYKGEVVTAVLNRGGYSWMSLNDGVNTISVWLKSSLAKNISFMGGYKCKGDIIRVSGIFNRACHVHGGELDIHADDIAVVKTGFPIKETIDKGTIRIARILFLASFLLLIILRKRI
jgi:hypothetical protein